MKKKLLLFVSLVGAFAGNAVCMDSEQQDLQAALKEKRAEILKGIETVLQGKPSFFRVVLHCKLEDDAGHDCSINLPCYTDYDCIKHARIILDRHIEQVKRFVSSLSVNSVFGVNIDRVKGILDTKVDNHIICAINEQATQERVDADPVLKHANELCNAAKRVNGVIGDDRLSNVASGLIKAHLSAHFDGNTGGTQEKCIADMNSTVVAWVRLVIERLN